MRGLFIGDPHATPEELDDCEALMGLIEQAANLATVDFICFMGDQHHTHNVIRAEVMAFYRAYFKSLVKRWHVRALVGNHDYAGEGQEIHSMMMYDEIIEVVDRPALHDGVLYMPYYSDRDAFLEDVKVGGKTLVCHQTFDGSRYENGFYAQDGVSPLLVPQTEIISGHIHTPQSFGKVTYIGAPRWRSRDDANISRALWVYDFDAEGAVVGKTPWSTDKTCRMIRYVLDTPETPFDGVFDTKSDFRIDIQGPAAWVEERKALWGLPGVKVRSFYTDRATVRVRESEGIGTAFHTYLDNYTPKGGTDRARLAEMALERLHV